MHGQGREFFTKDALIHEIKGALRYEELKVWGGSKVKMEVEWVIVNEVGRDLECSKAGPFSRHGKVEIALIFSFAANYSIDEAMTCQE